MVRGLKDCIGGDGDEVVTEGGDDNGKKRRAGSMFPRAEGPRHAEYYAGLRSPG